MLSFQFNDKKPDIMNYIWIKWLSISGYEFKSISDKTTIMNMWMSNNISLNIPKSEFQFKIKNVEIPFENVFHKI